MFFLISNPIVEPLQHIVELLNGWVTVLPLPEAVSSYAVALILIAVVIKLVTYPLTVTQMRSMRAMQELQPKLSELQDRFEDDREKLAQKQMELYREHGVNPFGGCLPLIVQMVVLFSLYRAIMNMTDQMAGEDFLWVPDLAQCEPSPLCADVSSPLGLAIPFLLLTMVVSQFAYQRFSTPPSSDNPQAAAMSSAMKFMPLMFAFIFAKLPAGLVLYYTTFNVVGVVQQAFINRAADEESAAGAGSNGQLDAPTEHDSTRQEEPKRDERKKSRRRRRKKSR